MQILKFFLSLFRNSQYTTTPTMFGVYLVPVIIEETSLRIIACQMAQDENEATAQGLVVDAMHQLQYGHSSWRVRYEVPLWT